MTLATPPHRPSVQEIEAGVRLNLPRDEKAAEVMLSLAGKALNNQDYENAEKILKGLVMVRPDDARVYEAFGVVYQAQGRLEDAIVCFETALEANPEALHANVNLGEIAFRKQRNAERAKTYLERVIKAAPTHPVANRARSTLTIIKNKGCAA